MRTAEIVTIGSELLRGMILNTNARFLGRELTDLGFEVRHQTACRDCLDDIQQKLKESIAWADLVILSGGLGPTPDDLTRAAVANFLKVDLVLSRGQLELIQKHYRLQRKPVSALVRQEALYPANGVPLINRWGVAAGFAVSIGQRLLIALPGVPYELENMFRVCVVPLLKKRFKARNRSRILTAKFAGISEPQLVKRLGPDFFKRNAEYGIYPEPGELMLRIQAPSAALISNLKKRLVKCVASEIYTFQDESLAEVVGKILKRRHQTLAVAESCTGGLLQYEIVKNPGASRYFVGGAVVYQNRVKAEMLDVPGSLIAAKGAVSADVASALAVGVQKKMKSTYGLGITGIAGPEGGDRTKPAGLVFIAVAAPDAVFVKSQCWRGSRQLVQSKAAKKALEMLWRILAKKSGSTGRFWLCR